MDALNTWYDTMTKGQRIFVYLVSAGLLFLFGAGLVPLALLIYLELGKSQRNG